VAISAGIGTAQEIINSNSQLTLSTGYPEGRGTGGMETLLSMLQLKKKWHKYIGFRNSTEPFHKYNCCRVASG
jgi:hypothetical protein